MELNGKWSGIMHDVEGHKAQIDLELKQSGAELSGEVCYTPVTTHREESLRGVVRGRVRGDRVQLEYTVQGEKGSWAVVFKGQVVPVKVHARASLLGTYQVVGGDRQPLAGGVTIFWLYAGQA